MRGWMQCNVGIHGVRGDKAMEPIASSGHKGVAVCVSISKPTLNNSV